MSSTGNSARAAAEKLWNGEGEKRVSIWVDCDTGHDDAFALLLASQTPKIHLLGVSTVHGNASLANTTKNTLSVLEALGRREIAVYPGSSKPFCREAVHAEAIHGSSGLDGTTILPEPVRTIPEITGDDVALKAMYTALINTPPGTSWVVSTGALTNIALLFAIYPSLIEHIAGLSIMGAAIGGFFTHAPMGRLQERVELGEGLHKVLEGGVGDGEMDLTDVVGRLREEGLLKDSEGLDDEKLKLLLNQARQSFGNTTPFAEFNIYCDPEAAASIFSRPTLAAKTTLIPLDITHQVLANDTITKMLQYGYAAPASPPPQSSPIRHLFHEILTFFTKTYAHEFAMNTGPPLHDPLAVAAAFVPNIFDDNNNERYKVYVVTEGDSSLISSERDASKAGQCGRTIVKLLGKGEEGVRIPRTLQVEEFWHLIDLSLGKAEKTGFKTEGFWGSGGVIESQF